MKYEYIKNGASLSLDPDACNGCGSCADVCPHGVFIIASGKAAIAHRAACMECGACALNCPTGALTVKAGVGCAAAIINGKLRGSTPVCDCGGSDAKDPARGSSKGACCG
jgi:NAD-dependent dihydropyrimidine dehydrogenase PreA subunit